jgi:hypothetical protein
MEDDAMVLNIERTRKGFGRRDFGIVLVGLLVVMVVSCGSALAAAPKQRTFTSPETAVSAFVDTLKADDVKGLSAIFGPGSQDLISSGDPVADKRVREKFVKLYEEKNHLERAGEKKVVLNVGNDDWPFPVPIVKVGKNWRFDTKAGRLETLCRRIGSNEIAAIQVALAYVDAQREYALKDRDSNGLLEYARKFTSSTGLKDGLYWEAKEGEERSPLGLLAAKAADEGYGGKLSGGAAPYHGYYYRILTAQGQHAAGGAYDYIVDGKMIGGFALVAYPARYRSSGVMTFIVNQDGVVYEKNLGKNTEKLAKDLKAFDPDKTWKKIQ